MAMTSTLSGCRDGGAARWALPRGCARRQNVNPVNSRDCAGASSAPCEQRQSTACKFLHQQSRSHPRRVVEHLIELPAFEDRETFDALNEVFTDAQRTLDLRHLSADVDRERAHAQRLRGNTVVLLVEVLREQPSCAYWQFFYVSAVP